jgi:hypothetical protein
MFQPSNDADSERSASKRRDDLFAEAVTGWATNLFFPLPKFPNHYLRLPWRRICKSLGSVRGALFVARILAIWPFELALEIARSSNETRLGESAPREYASQFSHGNHFCHLYQNTDSLMKMLSPFVAEGLKKGERCFCVQTPPVRERLCADLLEMGVDVDREIDRGALMFRSQEELYFEPGGFDVKRLLDQLGQLITDSLEAGFSGLRTAGDMSRAFSDPMLQKQIVEYERAVDDFYADKKAIAFCNYRLDGLSPANWAPVIDAHGFHVMDPHGVGAA